FQEDLFAALRNAWAIDYRDYLKSFESEDALVSMGDMGFSGSTFFRTSDGRYLVKSVPRQFEYSFFKDDLLRPYADYMQRTETSLLVRITDFLQPVSHTIGTALGTAPSHQLVMENILYGQDKHDEQDHEGKQKWESWDLKPMSYFYPERDVAGGALTSDETKSKLADEFHDKLVLSLDDAEDFKAQLEKDTKLLADCNAVDYSLFLVRIPIEATEGGAAPPPEPPFAPPSPPSWRTGVSSADGNYAYRAAVLDFFWAKHKTQALAMTGLINAYNAVDRQGPMSITTDAPEYRQRFLAMCNEFVE
ncbi:hypothetical protein BAUCODRAFT_58045, partial [Baudoinia panamericana UAMH 10762]